MSLPLGTELAKIGELALLAGMGELFRSHTLSSFHATEQKMFGDSSGVNVATKVRRVES